MEQIHAHELSHVRNKWGLFPVLANIEAKPSMSPGSAQGVGRSRQSEEHPRPCCADRPPREEGKGPGRS